MLKRLACDLKFIACAGRAVLCLDAVKKAICCALIVFAAAESIVLLCKCKDRKCIM